MSYREVLNLPISVFWTLTSYINRIKAENDLRAMTVVQAGQATQEGAEHIRNHLVIELAEPIKVIDYDDERDEEGASRLKSMFG